MMHVAQEFHILVWTTTQVFFFIAFVGTFRSKTTCDVLVKFIAMTVSQLFSDEILFRTLIFKKLHEGEVGNALLLLIWT